MSYISLSDKLALGAGRPTGFDYLRIGLAVAVICLHSCHICHGLEADIKLWLSPARPFVRLVLPMFFALSGFLVAGSIFRSSSIVQFLGLRVIRIYPALTVEVLLSALILGPILTTESLYGYLSNPLFKSYLLNITGDIHYFLPGLFAKNPFPDVVNFQLWTIPYELICYVVLAGLMISGLKTVRWLAPVSAVAIIVGYYILRFINHHGELPFMVGMIPGVLLVASFLLGVSLYLYSDRIRWSRSLCLLSGVASGLLLSVVPFGDALAIPVAAYFTISLGLTNPRKLRVLQGPDYSYGIYLYGFVIQQALVLTCPWAREWWSNILLSVPMAAVIAAASWHLVEKPALKLRRYLQPHVWKRVPIPTRLEAVE